MKLLRLLAFVCGATQLQALDVDDVLDRADAALRLRAGDDAVRLRVSGTVDLEAYAFSAEPPGLIDTEHDALFNPRLTLFLDGQLGGHLYLFGQARIDRGFDPGERGPRARLDEYAVRFTPWNDGRFTLQAGKFATVAGAFVGRHLSWDNPFINAPLPYEQATAASDIDPPVSVRESLRERATTKYERLPIIWGPSYATGVAVSGQLGPVEYAAEFKNSALSSRPEVWSAEKTGFEHPTFTGRVGFRPNEMWTFGASASEGSYLRERAEYVPLGRSFADYHETVFGQDVRFEWHHLQVWAEVFEARFDLPQIGPGDIFAYYLEAKYKWTPQLFTALRWNQEFFGAIDDRAGAKNVAWDEDVSRIDAALAFRFTAHLQLKLQYTVEIPHHETRAIGNTLGAQFTVRF